jgi:DNA (cytosine-5)-methyltransferase 1
LKYGKRQLPVLLSFFIYIYIMFIVLHGLDVFSGIGGLTLALSDWAKPIAYCEIDTYCQGVLLSRMADGLIGHAPIWDDIASFPVESFAGQVDFIYGGFPCQGFSIAGAGKGLEDERSGLFLHLMRLCSEIKPRFIFLENVPAICTRGGTTVVRQIASLGYDCRWCVISASSVGALHKRERWFLLAHAHGSGCEEQCRTGSDAKEFPSVECDSVCYSHGKSGREAGKEAKSDKTARKTWGGYSGQYWPYESREHWQETVSGVCRVSDGVPYGLDRLRALGNSVVYIQAKKAFKMLTGIEIYEHK